MNSDHDPELEAFLMGQDAAAANDAADKNREGESGLFKEASDNVRKMKTYFLKRDPADPDPCQKMPPPGDARTAEAIRKAPGPESVDEVMPKELSELVEEYHKVCETAKGIDAVKAELRGQILKVMGREESALVGKFVCTVKTRKTSRTDWQRFATDQFDKKQIEDMIGPYVTESESQVVEVKKIGK